jgi:Alpha amylase, catalytic domain
VTALFDRPPKVVPLRPHPHLYEINTWAWLERLSAQYDRLIRLGDVPDSEWDALADRGFDIIWLMGVWQRSLEARRIALSAPENIAQYDLALPGWKPSDVIGSPYSVAAYVPNSRIGTFDSIDLVREKLHARGMMLFLDFVGNHTALDHPWTRLYPEYYVQGTRDDFQKDPSSFNEVATPGSPRFLALGRDPYFPPWRDVAQLNHFSPEMRAAQIEELHAIAAYCDGVRCDMAMLHLNDIFGRVWSHLLRGAQPPAKEFWAEAHAAVPDLILLAEAYWDTEPRLLDLGFSFVYDKGLYDSVRDIDMAQVHARLGASVAYQSHLARFLENHDEARSESVFRQERLNSAGTLMGTLPGMRFYHQGELEGRRVHLPITLRICADEPPNPAAAAFFERVLRITNDDVFHTGQWKPLSVQPEGDATSRNIVVYEWRSGKSWKVISVNLAGCESQGRILFGDCQFPAKEYVFYDELHDVRYVRTGDELRSPGLFVRRDAFDAHLFDVTPV